MNILKDDEKNKGGNKEKKEDGKNEEMKQCDIYFVIDTTGSMSSYISSLNQVLEQICRMIKILFGGNARLHIISYKDYCDKKIIEECHSNYEIQTFVANKLRADGGGDAPEAAKTALNNLYQHIVQKSKSAENKPENIVFVYTDAPPHHSQTGSSPNNIKQEKAALLSSKPGFDWIRICAAFKSLNVPIYTFVSKSISTQTKLFWKMFGNLVEMPNVNVSTITKATIGCINQLMGCDDPEEFKFAKDFKLLKYQESDEENYQEIMSENNKKYTEDSCKKLLSQSQCSLKQIDFMNLESLSFLSNVLRNLPKKLLKDENFRNLVFKEFQQIFTKENILSISYNSVFGSIWRMLCRFREDERLKLLKNTFSLLITQLNDTDKNEMQDWLNDSYDDTEEINDIIKKHISQMDKESKNNDNDDGLKYVTLDAVDISLLPTKKELLSIAHSLYGDIIYKVQNIMTHLIMKKSKDNSIPFDSSITNSYIGIPSSLSNKQFFSLLSHLIINGTMFTLRPTLVIAMISYLSGNVLLKSRAKDILLQYKNKWISPYLSDEKLVDFPEFLSVPFMKLVLRCHKSMDNQLLTDEEYIFYNKLYKVYRIRLAKPKLFDVRIGFEPNLKQILKDYKSDCIKCKEHRSFTLMLGDKKCGKCTSMESDNEDGVNLEEYDDLKDKKNNSHLTQCYTCKAIYAVVDVNALNVRPKCHYCRNASKLNEIPTKQCKVCLNKWICPDQNYFGKDKSDKDWICPCCNESPEKATQIVQVPFADLVETYPLIINNMFKVKVDDIHIRKDMFSTMSLYKVYMKWKNALWIQHNDDEKKEELVIDVYDGKSIHNSKEILSSISVQVETGKLEDLCCLCFQEKQLILLESACGKCKNLMCTECLNTWYKQLEPGKLVLPTHLLCPFCKQRPHINTIKKYNKLMCTIIGGKKHNVLNEFNECDYYGWCTKCYHIKSAIKRECLRESLPELKEFKCDECRELELVNNMNNDEEYIKKTARICPGCKAPTVKISGCNHITCNNCGCHWCYQCQKEFDEDIIYEHMDEEHGGMGDEYQYE